MVFRLLSFGRTWFVRKGDRIEMEFWQRCNDSTVWYEWQMHESKQPIVHSLTGSSSNFTRLFAIRLIASFRRSLHSAHRVYCLFFRPPQWAEPNIILAGCSASGASTRPSRRPIYPDPVDPLYSVSHWLNDQWVDWGRVWSMGLLDHRPTGRRPGRVETTLCSAMLQKPSPPRHGTLYTYKVQQSVVRFFSLSLFVSLPSFIKLWTLIVLK